MNNLDYIIPGIVAIIIIFIIIRDRHKKKRLSKAYDERIDFEVQKLIEEGFEEEIRELSFVALKKRCVDFVIESGNGRESSGDGSIMKIISDREIAKSKIMATVLEEFDGD